MNTINILKHLVIILLCYMVASISIIGCSVGQTETFDPRPALMENEIEFSNITTGKISNSYYTACIIKNKTDKLYDFHVDFLYYGPGNRLLGVNQTIVQGFYPGMERILFNLGADDYTGANLVEARVVNIIKSEKSSITPNFKFDNLSVYHHEFGTEVFGEVTNLDEMQYSIILLAVIYDRNGNPIEANIHGVDNLYPGETRIFSAPLLDKIESDKCQVYLDSITSVIPAQKQANITFSNKEVNYDSNSNRGSLIFDVINNDTCRYQNIDLVVGFYSQGKLLYVREDYIHDIGPGETFHFDQRILEGDWTEKEVKININGYSID